MLDHGLPRPCRRVMCFVDHNQIEQVAGRLIRVAGGAHGIRQSHYDVERTKGLPVIDEALHRIDVRQTASSESSNTLQDLLRRERLLRLTAQLRRRHEHQRPAGSGEKREGHRQCRLADSRWYRDRRWNVGPDSPVSQDCSQGSELRAAPAWRRPRRIQPKACPRSLVRSPTRLTLRHATPPLVTFRPSASALSTTLTMSALATYSCAQSTNVVKG